MDDDKARISRSALLACLARDHLTWMGVVDDRYAQQLLPQSRDWRTAASLLRVPGLGVFSRSASIAYLAGRTRFYDDFVRDALEEGIRQVVVLGAGYDSRAWRFARPGAAFYEVDLLAIQADKRLRAPQSGPVYIPADVTDPALRDKLIAAGLDPARATAFTVEGVTTHLTESQVAQLLRTLRGLAGPGSLLAVDFGNRYAHDGRRRKVKSQLPMASVPAFLSAAGWRIQQTATGPQLQNSYLAGTRLARAKTTTGVFVVRADLAAPRAQALAGPN